MLDACSTTEVRPSPADLRAEKRARRLERMGDIGLDIAEKLQRQAALAAIYSETDAVPDNIPHSRRLDDIGRAFAQVSRAVSLSTALEDRIDKGLPALPDHDRADREHEAREKRAEVAKAVVRAIDADPLITNRRRIVDLRICLDRMLDRELADLDRFLRRPFHEIEARLCRELGVEPEADGFDDPDLPPLGGDSRAPGSGQRPARGQAPRGRGGPATAVSRKAPDPQHPSCEPPTAGSRPPAPPRGGRSFAPTPLKSPSPDADAPSIPCRERKIARMGPRTARGRAPP